jgi:microcystin-dependent protein
MRSLFIALVFLAIVPAPSSAQTVIAVGQMQGHLGNVAATSDTAVDVTAPPSLIDSVALVTGRKYLLTGQTDATENGIWVYDGADLVRPAVDRNLVDGFDRCLIGSTVHVSTGLVFAGEIFRLYSTDSTALDGYGNAVLTIGTHTQFFRRLGNRCGEIVPSFAAVYPGAIKLSGGGTVGNATSGATFAGPQYREIFEILKTVSPNTGTEVFAAGDTVDLPDMRGRTVAGHNSMGSASSGRLTSAGGGVDGNILGAVGGAQSVTLAETHLPVFTKYNSHATNSNTQTGGSGARVTALSTVSYGGGNAHANVQPTLIANWFLCY